MCFVNCARLFHSASRSLHARFCGIQGYSRSRGFSLLELLIALALGSFICVGIFNIYFSLNRLSQQQHAISNFSQTTRFMADFLRNKINQAGDWSCLSRSPGSRSLPVKGYDSDDAQDQLGLTIKSGTDLLQLKECIRLHGKMHYLPVEFFIADTFRVNQFGHSIYALFFKVGHHPREELITGMTKFNLSLGVRDRSQKNIRAYHKTDSISDWKKVGAVAMRYTLFDYDSSSHQSGVLYAGLWAKEK